MPLRKSRCSRIIQTDFPHFWRALLATTKSPTLRPQTWPAPSVVFGTPESEGHDPTARSRNSRVVSHDSNVAFLTNRAYGCPCTAGDDRTRWCRQVSHWLCVFVYASAAARISDSATCGSLHSTNLDPEAGGPLLGSYIIPFSFLSSCLLSLLFTDNTCAFHTSSTTLHTTPHKTPACQAKATPTRATAPTARYFLCLQPRSPRPNPTNSHLPPLRTTTTAPGTTVPAPPTPIPTTTPTGRNPSPMLTY